MVKLDFREKSSIDALWSELRKELEPIVEKYEKDYGIVINTLTYTKHRDKEFSTRIEEYPNSACDITV